MGELPVSEIFVEIQGEGVYNGVKMCFVRLAGCTVGKPYSLHHRDVLKLPIYTEECTLYDGRKFACDTDYRVKERITCPQIVSRIPHNIKHVCITGGEPMMHDLSALITLMYDKGKKVHIETSGTKDTYLPPDVWITVSPKFNPYYAMILRADEIKLLVDEHFDPMKAIHTLHNGMVQAVYPVKLAEEKPVYLHPVNDENTVNKDNLSVTKYWCDKYPQFRLGIQTHKVLTEFLGVRVR